IGVIANTSRCDRLRLDVIDRETSLPTREPAFAKKAVNAPEGKLVPQPRFERGVRSVTPGAVPPNVRHLRVSEQGFRGRCHGCSSSASSLLASASNSLSI